MSSFERRSWRGRAWKRAALGLAAGALVVSAGTSPAAAETIGNQCGGKLITIKGTEGDDFLRGTDGPDVIAGFGGDDVILGFGGDDVLCGGEGNDWIDDGTGQDTMYGEGGVDTFYLTLDGEPEYVNGDARHSFGGRPEQDNCLIQTFHPDKPTVAQYDGDVIRGCELRSIQ